MNSKKWIVMFICCVLSLPLLLAGLNYVVDPFGVFGNMKWYSFSETLSPRVAKTAYLDEHWDDYDSYLVGCSSTSSFPVDDLNRYLDAHFYNDIVYGADMLDSEQMVAYLLENDDVKNIVLNLYIDNGLQWNTSDDDITLKMHEKVSGSSPIKFYMDYLMADPNYAKDKLVAFHNDTWLNQPFDVFDEQTGAYDKRARDIENISDLETYYQKYPVFTQYPISPKELSAIDDCMKSVVSIRDMCEEAGVNLYVVCPPVYGEYLNSFTSEGIATFYKKLADVTNYWDFTYSSVSVEPRYFYDDTHFRNAVGDMALARMFNDQKLYIPDDFGTYVTKDNVDHHVESLLNRTKVLDDSVYTSKVPVLMYHHMSPEGDGDINIPVALFDDQMHSLSQAGYNTVTFEQLYNYVTYGEELPDNPIVITFDDGYESNYQYAYPILEKYGMKAMFFPIGSSVGKDVYGNTDMPIFPHYDWDAIRDMSESGVIQFGTHTDNMHKIDKYENGPFREGMYMMDGESESEYLTALREDITLAKSELEAVIDAPVNVLSYPMGYYTPVTEAVCKEQGMIATVTTEERCNTLVKGLPQCLFGMGRINVVAISGEELLEKLAVCR